MKEFVLNAMQWLRRGTPETKFRRATLAFLPFGCLCLILCDLLAPSGAFGTYAAHLLLCFAIGGTVYALVRLLLCRHWICKVLLAVSGTAVLGMTVLVWLFMGFALQSFEARTVEYVDEYDVLHANTAQVSLELLDKCHVFGQGEPFYKYPQTQKPKSYDPEQWKLYTNSFRERNRAEAVFADFRGNAALPVLSYSYGLWILALYILLSWSWFRAAGKAATAIASRWNRLLFLGTGLTPAILTAAPLLSALGLLPLIIPHPFSGNTAVNLILLVPSLAIMLALADHS